MPSGNTISQSRVARARGKVNNHMGLILFLVNIFFPFHEEKKSFEKFEYSHLKEDPGILCEMSDLCVCICHWLFRCNLRTMLHDHSM